MTKRREISEEDLALILNSPETGAEIGRQLNLPRNVVNNIRRRERWVRPESKFGSYKSYNRLTEEQANQIIAGGMSQNQFAKAFGVSPGAVTGVIYGRTWRHLDRPKLLEGPKKLSGAS